MVSLGLKKINRKKKSTMLMFSFSKLDESCAKSKPHQLSSKNICQYGK